MIQKIHLKNFQIHKDTLLNFSSHLFVCIVGPSRSGKSSLVRALRWLFFDKWRSSYVKIGSTFSTINLVYNNNNIERIKGQSKNEIIINSQKFSSFGTELPQEFFKIFPWADSKFEKLVIASQDDFPFLLYEDGSSRREYFDFFIGMDSLTLYVDNLQHEIGKKSVEERELTSTITELSSRLKELEELEMKYKKLEDLYEKVKKVEEERISLERALKLFVQIKELKEKIEKLKKKIIFLQTHQEGLERIFFLEHLIQLKTKMTSLSDHLKEISNTISSKEKNLDDLIKQGVICPTCGQVISKI